MKQQRKEQWNHVMKLIHKCEDKYGSIKQTPADDETWLEIKSLCNVKHPVKEMPNPEIEALIVKEISEGRSEKYIHEKHRIDFTHIHQVMAKHKLVNIPTFYYVLSKKGEATYVLTSQVRGVSAVFHHNFHNTMTLNRFLKAHGYKLRSKEMLWKNIPVGTYYVGPNYSKPILKRNDRYLA